MQSQGGSKKRPEVSVVWSAQGTVTACEHLRITGPFAWLEQHESWAPVQYAVQSAARGRWQQRVCDALLRGARAVRAQQRSPVAAGAAVPSGASRGGGTPAASRLRQRALGAINRMHQGLVFDASPSADVLLLCRNLMPEFAGRARRVAQERGVPLVYDTDDLLIAVPDHLPRAQDYLALRPLLLDCIRHADHLTVPNQILADELADLNPSISILPSFMDADLWGVDAVPPPSEEPVTVGYWGTPSHLPDLQRLTAAFRHLKQKYGRRIRFRFMGCHDPEMLSLEDVSVGSFVGTYAGYAAATRSHLMEIAIAPLADSRFNRCKSPIKFFEYSIRGACGLYADLPPYQGVVRHGENGFLIGPEVDAWVGALERLIEEPALRYRLACQAQADVLARHTLDCHGWRWHDAFTGVIQRGPRRPRRRMVAGVR